MMSGSAIQVFSDLAKHHLDTSLGSVAVANSMR